MCFKRSSRLLLNRLIPLLLSLFILSGCALNTNKPTLEAIQALDNRLEQRLDELEQQNKRQSTQLSQLHAQLQQNSQTIAQLKASQTKLLTLTEARQKKAELYNARNLNSAQTLTASAHAANTQGKIVLGSKEWVWLDAAQDNFKARVDSGATTSSIHAPEPVFFERNGEDWVRFSLISRHNQQDNLKQIEAPVVRWVRIIQASAEQPERRAVIETWIQVGGLREKAEFTLADRSNMTFQILLGREFFKDVALIDVGKSYIHPKQNP